MDSCKQGLHLSSYYSYSSLCLAGMTAFGSFLKSHRTFSRSSQSRKEDLALAVTEAGKPFAPQTITQPTRGRPLLLLLLLLSPTIARSIAIGKLFPGAAADPETHRTPKHANFALTSSRRARSKALICVTSSSESGIARASPLAF